MKKWNKVFVKELDITKTFGGTGSGRTEEEILGDYTNGEPGWDWKHEGDSFYEYWLSSPKGTTVES